ncbi:hypothetical protein [Streptomyces luteocolor]|uniref:hypothetical protein n=1 Tax=Streptomyces luteocolor TaxID=285500 RepID=UPI0008531E35|nr:hypothetical protein [Streptomyces luteocolor]
MTPLGIPVYAVVSLGGVAVGLSLIAWDVSRWWASNKKRLSIKALRKIGPFILSFAYGTLLILSAGGIIGGLADWSLWGTNQVGDITLVYGFGGTTPSVTRGSQLALTPGGHVVIVVVTVVFAAVTSVRGFRWDLVRGALAGVSLGLASSVAGLAGFLLAPAVSLGGDWAVGLL